jgi:hypothetical protein
MLELSLIPKDSQPIMKFFLAKEGVPIKPHVATEAGETVTV